MIKLAMLFPLLRRITDAPRDMGEIIGIKIPQYMAASIILITNGVCVGLSRKNGVNKLTYEIGIYSKIKTTVNTLPAFSSFVTSCGFTRVRAAARIEATITKSIKYGIF